MEGLDRVREKTRVLGCIDLRAVVERIGIDLGLHAEVAIRTASRMDLAAVQNCDGTLELVALVVVDQVAALEYEIGPERPNGLYPPEKD
jgi:hypothetical protein